MLELIFPSSSRLSHPTKVPITVDVDLLFVINVVCEDMGPTGVFKLELVGCFV